MNRKKLFTGIVAVSLIAAFEVVARSALSQQSAEEFYQAALLKKEAEGDLNGAIQLFQKVITTYPENTAIAAKAQLQVGLCYKKLLETLIELGLERFAARAALRYER